MNRRIFAFSLLSALAFSGCVNSGGDYEGCGNGILDEGEVCDGDQFKNGSTCPSGVGTLTCTTTCTVDSSACQEPASTCNNGTLEPTEECDGTLFAAGKDKCPSGMAGNVTCGTDCRVVTAGCTSVPACNNGVLDAGEACDGGHFAETPVCPEGTTGDVSKIYCNDQCEVVTSSACRVEDAAPVCGDGQLNAAGEDCENSVYGVVNAAGHVITCENYMGSGATGVVKCADCKLDASACQAADAGSDCNNGTLDAGEVCDGSAFAENAGDSCGANYTAKDVLKCAANCQLDIEASCEPVEVVHKCGNNVLDAGEQCDGKAVDTNYVWSCPAGMDKAENIVCDDTCKIYVAGSCKEQACGNGVIDGVEACDKTAFSDHDRPVCASGLVPKPDKANWACTSNCMIDNVKSCEPAGECSDSSDLIKCENNVALTCIDGKWQEWNACSEYEVCSEDASADNVNYCVGKTCTAEEENNIVCSANGTKESMCIGGEWATAECQEGKVCVDGEGCVVPEVKPCGNGYRDAGEQCETIDGYFVPWEYGVINCNYYNEKYPEDGYTLYKSGEPTCTDECKISIQSCQKLTAEDFTQVKSWKFDSGNIASLTQSGEVTIHNAGNSGFKPSQYSSSAWELGKWPSGNLNWDAYMWFTVGTVSTNAVSITFEAKRGNNGPKSLKVKAYSNGKSESHVMGTSAQIDLTTDMQTYTVQFKSKSTIGDFSFKVSAYNGNGSMFIQNVKVSSANAI